MNKLLALTLLAMSYAHHANADTLLQTADQEGDFKTFLQAVKTAGLESTLNDKGPITLLPLMMRRLPSCQKQNLKP